MPMTYLAEIFSVRVCKWIVCMTIASRRHSSLEFPRPHAIKCGSIFKCYKLLYIDQLTFPSFVDS